MNRTKLNHRVNLGKPSRRYAKNVAILCSFYVPYEPPILGRDLGRLSITADAPRGHARWSVVADRFAGRRGPTHQAVFASSSARSLADNAGWQGKAYAQSSVGFLPETKLEFAVSDELVDKAVETLKEAQVLIERWRHHYNTVRPHSALGYRPPAPQTIVPKRTDPAFAMDGLQPDQPFPETVPALT